MQPLLTTALVLLFAASCPNRCLAAQARAPGVVHELSQLTIDSYIKSATHKPILLEFYAPWCSHCTRFAPAYAEIAEHLHDDAFVARVDGARHKALALRFRVRAFPSFFLIHAGTVTQFVGTRSQAALLAFVSSRGEQSGNSLDHFGGPLSPYWSIVSAAFRLADAATRRVEQYQADGGSLVLLVLSIVVGTLAAFLVAIYIITTPRKLPPPPPQTHAHAE